MVETTVDATPTTTATTTPVDWRAGLTGDFAPLAQEKSLESFKGKDWTEVGPHLAKAFLETKKLVGAKPPAIKIPDASSTPEETASYRKAIGVPETADGYSVTLPEMPPGEEWDDAARGTFLARMHEVGAPPHIVQAIATWYGTYLNQMHAGFRRESDAAAQELRRDWGPNYDANLGRANRAIQQYGGDALVDLFAQNGMGRHPLVVRVFSKIGHDLVEAGAMPGDTVGRLTPDDAQERLKTLQVDLAKTSYGSDAHKALIEQILQISKIAQGRSA